MNGADALVAITNNDDGDDVDEEGYYGQYPESPGKSDVLDHGIRAQGINDTAYSCSTCCEGVGERPLLREPLRYHPYGGSEEEAHSQAESHSLAEDQVPDLRGEGGANKGDTERA